MPGLKDVVQGSTFATSSRPRVSARRSFSCFPDEPRKMRGLFISSSNISSGVHGRHCGKHNSVARGSVHQVFCPPYSRPSIKYLANPTVHFELSNCKQMG